MAFLAGNYDIETSSLYIYNQSMALKTIVSIGAWLRLFRSLCLVDYTWGKRGYDSAQRVGFFNVTFASLSYVANGVFRNNVL